MSRKTNIPLSSVFDIVKSLEHSVIHKHTSLLDFSKVGMGAHAFLRIKADDKNKLREFIRAHKNVNTFSTLLPHYDFLVEAVFPDLKEYTLFKESLEQQGAGVIDENFIVEELKREGFFSAK